MLCITGYIFSGKRKARQRKSNVGFTDKTTSANKDKMRLLDGFTNRMKRGDNIATAVSMGKIQINAVFTTPSATPRKTQK